MMGLLADKEELRNLRKVFKALDVDGDGTISKEEMENAAKEFIDANFRESKWGQIIESLDMDGDGTVDYHEFITSATNH